MDDKTKHSQVISLEVDKGRRYTQLSLFSTPTMNDPWGYGLDENSYDSSWINTHFTAIAESFIWTDILGFMCILPSPYILLHTILFMYDFGFNSHCA